MRLQRALVGRGEPSGLDRVLTVVHWAWFLEPHLALVWILVRHNERFAARRPPDGGGLRPRLRRLLRCVPTAPPWWAAEQGYTAATVRRVMVEVGEPIWGRAWPSMYDSLGGNPWAAMPSLHFATSLLAAILLAETGAVEGVGGMGLRAHARLRARLPRRALRGRPVAGAALVAPCAAASRCVGPVAACSAAASRAWSGSRMGSRRE